MKFLNGNKQERSVWNIPLCTGNERLKDKNGKKLHATQKPEKLLEKVILSSTKPGDLILDPFMGTGTTAAVATQLARNFVGIEREEKYVKAATERVKAVPYVTNDPIMLASLDVKKPRVPIERLIEAGMLKERESLFDKFGGNGVVLKTTGCLDDGDSVLSIHKMSAKKLGKTNHNGWDYWFVKRGDDLVSINEFRENYREQFENE